MGASFERESCPSRYDWATPVEDSMFIPLRVLPLKRFSLGTAMHLMLSVIYPMTLRLTFEIARYVLERSLFSVSKAFSLRKDSVAESYTDLNDESNPRMTFSSNLPIISDNG